MERCVMAESPGRLSGDDLSLTLVHRSLPPGFHTQQGHLMVTLTHTTHNQKFAQQEEEVSNFVQDGHPVGEI